MHVRLMFVSVSVCISVSYYKCCKQSRNLLNSGIGLLRVKIPISIMSANSETELPHSRITLVLNHHYGGTEHVAILST